MLESLPNRQALIELALPDGERHQRELLDALPVAIYTTDVAGRMTYYNQACVEFAGRTPEIGTDEWCVTWRLYWPDGTFLPHDQCAMAIALKEARAIHGAEAMAERPDGTRVPFLAYPAPLRDASGAVVGAINMLVDITERKRSEDQRHLLVNELNHRVKNTLATVQSIAAQSFRRESESDSYRWFEGRLVALSEAHDVLSRENWEAAPLHDIIAQVVAPLEDEERQRFAIEGPLVRLRPKVALSLAMVLHELCTNAAKYGALSNGSSGRILIQWRLSGDDDARILHLRWQETGGPAVATPLRKGFGSRLIEQGLARELGAEVRLIYAVEGVVCEIDAPL